MSYAKDFRQMAREGLRGKWLLAVLAGLIASVLGGNVEGISTSNLSFKNGFDAGYEAGMTGAETEFLDELGITVMAFLPWIIGLATVVVIIAIVISLVFLLIGSNVAVGYAQFNLSIVDGTEARLESLFAFFKNWKTNVIANLLQGIYIFLWSLLFIIPGIVASYRYAMTSFILAEHPEYSASQAIQASKNMMDGNKWRMFCLDLSFIGWRILAAFTLGIGYLWLGPYIMAARAAFYREISGTKVVETETDGSFPTYEMLEEPVESTEE